MTTGMTGGARSSRATLSLPASGRRLCYRIPNTFSGGRPTAALPLRQTMGRSIRMGLATISLNHASGERSSVVASPSSVNRASYVRMISSGVTPRASQISASSAVEGGVSR